MKRFIEEILFFSLIALVWLPLTSFKTDAIKELGVKIVVIDAGHGGKDSGCLGANSQEKNIALSIALKLGAFIEQNYKDVKVIYTRKTDVFIELNERAKIANENKADLFICVHANANNSKSANGTETFVMGLHKSQANLNIAKRENSSILMEDGYKDAYQFDPNSDESYVAFSLIQNAFLGQSISFANKIQHQFVKIGRKNRNVKQAGFLVLYRTTMPSVLIETGFLTNLKDEAFLTASKNQDLMANSIFKAFKEYKTEIEQIEITTTKTTDETPKDTPPKEKKETTKKTEIKPNPALYPKAVKKENTSNLKVWFGMQVATTTKSISPTPANFKGFEMVKEIKVGNRYKYIVGKISNMKDAVKLQEKVRTKGYKDSFMVGFINDKKVSVAEAKKQLTK